MTTPTEARQLIEKANRVATAMINAEERVSPFVQTMLEMVEALEAFLPKDETETVDPTCEYCGEPIEQYGHWGQWLHSESRDEQCARWASPVTREAQEQGDAFTCADLGHEDCDGSHPDHHIRETQEPTNG